MTLIQSKEEGESRGEVSCPLFMYTKSGLSACFFHNVCAIFIEL